MRFGFIWRRVLYVVPMLAGLLTVTFFVTRIIPGDPTYQIAGQFATPETLARIRHAYGFDQSLVTQYWNYVKGVVLHGNLGVSIVSGNTVRADLQNRFPATIELVACALAIALAIGIPVGLRSGLRRGSREERVTRGLTFALLALPDFWLALLAIYVFYFRLRIAPAPTGQLGIGQSIDHPITNAALLDGVLKLDPGLIGDALKQAALPFLTLGILVSASIARLMRSSTIAVMDSDYVRYARACGVDQRALRRWIVRAALPPVVTLAGVIFTVLLGAAVLIETIFSWQGAAQYAANAIQREDYSAVQGFVLVVGVLSLVTFLVVDVIHALLDPRVTI